MRIGPDPLVAAFRQQRLNAKQRGIGWELPYWEWLQIWQDSGHLHERGVSGGQWVMARHGDRGPYAAYNVKIAHTESNSSESACRRWSEYRAGQRGYYGQAYHP